MAWILLPGGLLMPARIPNGGVEGQADATLTDNGRLDLQVRGRVGSHLQNFIRDYVEPLGFEHSALEYTPKLDYNVRFYMTKQDFAQALAAAMLDIDYLKFKPTAERVGTDGKPLYKDGKEYHGVLNSMWGTLTRLGAPGGTWGAYSSTNTRGYKPRRRGIDRIGDTFGKREEQKSWWELEDGDMDTAKALDDLDYTPQSEHRLEDLANSLRSIPTEQWADYVNDEDLLGLADYMESQSQREQAIARSMTRSRHERRNKNRK